MSKYIRDVLGQMENAIYNPNVLQDAILDTLEDANNNVNFEILDPNNPVVFTIEGAVTLAQASIEQGQRTLQRRNPIMATEWEDLYSHMSDKDFIDPFAQPDRATFQLIVGKQEVINKAEPRDSSGVRKLVIPADSVITIAGYPFTLQYPIELRVMPYGGIQAIYDTSRVSPVRELSSNTLDWEVVTIPFDGRPIEMLRVAVPAMQYAITSFNDSITAGVGWRQQYSFSDQFFMARVWLRSKQRWVELPTTHSVEVIDPTVVTAQLQVIEGALRVHIPDVYIRSGLARGDIRIDIYTTKGPLGLDLGHYNSGQFEISFRDLTGELDPLFFRPLTTMQHLSIISTDLTYGGRNALTFGELRDRVIDNSIGGRRIPISEKQLGTVLSDMGFSVKKSIDYVTERVYLASADLPTPSIDGLSTPIGSINGIVEVSFDGLSQLDTVRDNGQRLTLLPSTLYEYRDGKVELLSNEQMTFVRQRAPEQLLSVANDSTYLYTPFHYVIDINGEIVEARPYYLSSPKIDSKRFVASNETLALEVSTGTYSLEMTDRGYRLLLKTRSDQTYRELDDSQCHCQISFTPRGYSDEYAYVYGTLLGRDEEGERVFEFHIETNLDMDRNHDMIVTNFTLFGSTATPIPLQLLSAMNVLYGVSSHNVPDYRASAIDNVMTSNRGERAATHEVLRLNLGSFLGALWANARTVVGTIAYRRYAEDVYDTWKTDVRERDPETGAYKYQIVEVDGKSQVTMVYKHRVGDLKLKDGQPILLHRAGDIIYGDDGQPLVDQPRKIRRRLDLCLFDAKFQFSNTEETKTYIGRVVQQLLQYILVDIPSIDPQLLERTRIFFYPKTTLGQIDVLLGDGTSTKYNAEVKFAVSYYLTRAARQNGEFLTALSETTRSAILVNLKRPTISTTAITAEIRSRLGEEIVDVTMGGFGEDGDELLFTVKDDTVRPTLGKKLSINPDRSLSVRDDISITYNRHEVTA